MISAINMAVLATDYVSTLQPMGMDIDTIDRDDGEYSDLTASSQDFSFILPDGKQQKQQKQPQHRPWNRHQN